MNWDINDFVPLTYYTPDGDGTTNATITYANDTAGSGTVSPAPTTSDGGKSWSALKQVTASGLWTFVWSLTGGGAGTEKYTLYVNTATATPVPWVPDLRTVADYVPSRTIPVDTPADDPLMTFDATTRPTGEQVARIAQGAVRWVANSVGTVDPTLYEQATDVAAIRAAGMVELVYPVRDADVQNAQALLAQADAALVALQSRNEAVTGTSPEAESALMPQFSFPDPHLTEDVRSYRVSDWGGQPRHGGW